MRVFFDRSAFHGDRFNTLLNSPFRALVATGRIKAFLTPVFIDETASQYGSPRAADDWRAHLQFAAETCNGGVFLDKPAIWRNELVSGKGPFARYLLPERCSRRYQHSRVAVLSRLAQIAQSGALEDAWLQTAAEREAIQHKKNRQRELYSRIRDNVSDALRQNGYLRSSWSKYMGTDFLKVGRYLMKLVHRDTQAQLAEVWAVNPWHYPYYSAFVQGLMYAIYHAAEKLNERIDRNSQADYEQLAYLTWTDAVVSNDDRFFRQAFDTIWKPRGKRILSTEEFADLLTAIGT